MVALCIAAMGTTLGMLISLSVYSESMDRIRMPVPRTDSYIFSTRVRHFGYLRTTSSELVQIILVRDGTPYFRSRNYSFDIAGFRSWPLTASLGYLLASNPCSTISIFPTKNGSVLGS